MFERPDQSSYTYRLFAALIDRRKTSVAIVAGLIAALGFIASGVRADYSIEMSFPTFHDSRTDYEAYKRAFPGDDARAVVIIEATDLYTPDGIARVRAIEDEFATIEGVLDVEGLTTTNDVVSAGDGFILLEPLFPDEDLDQQEIDRRRHTVTTDPLFKWNLAPADGRAAIVRVNLTPEYASEDGTRSKFLAAARIVAAKHDAIAAKAGAEQTITLGGIPINRSEYTELVTSDLHTMFPIAFMLIMGLLFLTFRRIRYVFAAYVTILVSVVWTVGIMGLLGFPMQILTQITPIVVMIISISDTVHIVAHFREGLGEGRSVRDSIVDSMALNAWPCLLTEITIAGGFIALVANDMVMTQQFGIVTAAGMLVTWLANVTVLPLVLSMFAAKDVDRKKASETGVTRSIHHFISFVEHIVTTRARRVFIVTGVIVAIATVCATGIETEFRADADLRDGSPLKENLHYVEDIHGGTIPLVIHIEGDGEDAMLEPEALAVIDRVTNHLESEYPEIRTTTSFSKYIRKSHRLFAGEEIAAVMPLPSSRKLAAQELIAIDDPATLRHMISFDRSAAAITASMPDKGSARMTEILAKLKSYLASEQQSSGLRITATGIYTLSHTIYDSMVGGLAKSLGIAVFLSFFIFCIVLRSWRLGAIALIPNLLPLLLTLAVMAVVGIEIKPTTVILFSITLVIADDDTIQFLSRFRRRFMQLKRAGHHDPHQQASIDTLRETGVPMVITSVAISTGFLVLLGSKFLGLSHLGALTGIALFAAVFADLFLSPVLLTTLRPRIGRGGGRLPTATAEPPQRRTSS